MAKRIAKRPTSKRSEKLSSGAKNRDIRPSKLKLFDIPLDRLIPSPENPQEMDDATFDELVEGIKSEGSDEPIHVIRMYDDDGIETGDYMIVSGHHRVKASKAAGLEVIPAIIKPDMDDAARKIALVRRNQLRGKMNPKKFTELFREVAPVLGSEVAKRLMGFTKEAVFKKLYDDVTNKVAKQLPDQKKELDEAKETVKSVDDLSSVLNGIFRREGSKVQKGYMVFSYGGKKHHYFQIDKPLSNLLEEIELMINRGTATASETFMALLADRVGLSVEPKKTKKVLRRGKTGKNKT